LRADVSYHEAAVQQSDNFLYHACPDRRNIALTKFLNLVCGKAGRQIKHGMYGMSHGVRQIQPLKFTNPSDVMPRAFALRDYTMKHSPARTTPGGYVSCGFVGDSDIYGIGIRIGYYSQAIAVWFANFFVFAQASALQSINGLFVFALVVGLIWLSRKPADIFAVEAWLLMQLLTATHYIGVIDHSRFSRKYQRFDPVRRIIHEATFLALWLYMAWYYWNGLDHMKGTPCGTYVLFFVVKTDLFGWYRLLGKILTFVCIPVVLNYAAVVLATVLHHWHTRRIRSPKFIHNLLEELQSKQNSRRPSSCTNGPDAAHDLPHRRSYEAEQAPASTDATPGERPCLQTRLGVALETCPREQSLSSRKQNSFPENRGYFKESDKQMLAIAISIPLPLSPLDVAPGWQQGSDEESGASCAAQTMETDGLLSSLLVADAYIDDVLADFKPGAGCGRDHRPAIIFGLLRHLTESRAYSFYDVHEIFNTAVDHPQYHTISTEYFNVILSFRTLRFPHKNPSSGDFRALLTLAACCFLIISIELTIAWNHIEGLNSIGAVGQLVPAVLGVGGIVRVAWARWKESSNCRIEEQAVPEGLRQAAELYEVLKEASKCTG
ncbi:MAG: hypothetical protein Q9183_003070, partial [Haloplaca sp. 2 TL-2023]